MTRDLETMKNIQEQKAKDMEGKAPHPLDPEGIALAEQKRFTFDLVDTPTDPLR